MNFYFFVVFVQFEVIDVPRVSFLSLGVFIANWLLLVLVLEAVRLFCTVKDVKSTTWRVSFAQPECKPAKMTATIMEQKDVNPAEGTQTCQEEGIQSDRTSTCEKEQDGEPSGLTPICQAEKNGEPSDYRSKCNLEEIEPVVITYPVMLYARNLLCKWKCYFRSLSDNVTFLS